MLNEIYTLRCYNKSRRKLSQDQRVLGFFCIMDQLVKYASMDRNPIQDREFRKLLEQQGIPFTVSGDRTNVTGFGFGGNEAGQQAAAFFSPEATTARQQNTRQQELFGQFKDEESDFLNRFRTEYPQVLQGLEQTLNLPGLRQTAFDTSQQLQELPNVLEQAARGKDISANQLSRMTAAQTGELAPIAQKAVSQAQFAEEEFGRRAQQELLPFQTELDLMRDRFARETTGFSEAAQRELDVLINKMNNQQALTLAEMSQANQLAQLEAQNEIAKNSITYQDLGDRIGLFDQLGNLINTVAKGKLSTLGSSGNSGGFSDPAGIR